MSFEFILNQFLSHLCFSFCFTILKGNLTEGSQMANEIPSLMQLKKSVYAEEFRSFMERITGLEPGTLTEQVCSFYHNFNHSEQNVNLEHILVENGEIWSYFRNIFCYK